MNNSSIISIIEQGFMADATTIIGGVLVAVGAIFAIISLRQRQNRILKERAGKPTTQDRKLTAEPHVHIPGRARVMVLSNHGARLFKSVSDRIDALKRSMDELTVEKAKIVSGLEGEQQVGEFFSRYLNEEWTIIEGFLGEKGEIDFVLVGPLGVFAIEVKNRTGIISCNGDQWAITKPDGTVEQILDNGGRSPARQLSESAGWLASKLDCAGLPPLLVPTAIVWAHPKASLGSMTNMGVNYLILLGNIHQHFKDYLALGTMLTREQVSGVVQLVNSIHNRKP